MKFSKKNCTYCHIYSDFFLLTPYLACKYYENRYIKPYSTFLLKRKIADYKYIENGKALVIKWDYDNLLDYWITENSTSVTLGAPVVGQTKIVQEYNKLLTLTPLRNEPLEDEYWKIAVYDIKEKGFLSKEYDVFKMTRDYDSDYIPTRIASIIYISEGRELLDIHLKNAKDGSLVTKSIDLEKGKIVELGKEQDYEQYATATNFYNLLPESKDYFMLNWETGVSAGGKLDKDALIRQKYPDAAKLLEDNNGSIVVLAISQVSKTTCRFISCCIKKGPNLFENVTIPARKLNRWTRAYCQQPRRVY